eukprot:TRINITY_DN17642_c0_g1_i1.p1 TRINITY_DN17642_c0_g1~~TRINITY_DN17642_c0_g1_i1.p1  ORF type:complete len:638 (-),score=77.98 TRINITY_DN17642_c0_g1_i1:1333-3246(-)
MGSKGSKFEHHVHEGVLVALPTGQVLAYDHDVTAEEVLEDFPGYFISASCPPDKVADTCSSAIPNTRVLQPKKVYFLHPAEATSCERQERQLWDEQQGQLLGLIRCEKFSETQVNVPQPMLSPHHPVSPLSVQMALDKWLAFREEASESEPHEVRKACLEQSAYREGELLALRERQQAFNNTRTRKDQLGPGPPFEGAHTQLMDCKLLLQTPMCSTPPLMSPRSTEVAVGEWPPLCNLVPQLPRHELSRGSSGLAHVLAEGWSPPPECSPCSSPERSPLSWEGPVDDPVDVATKGLSAVSLDENLGAQSREPFNDHLKENPIGNVNESTNENSRKSFNEQFEGRFKRSPILYSSTRIASRGRSEETRSQDGKGLAKRNAADPSLQSEGGSRLCTRGAGRAAEQTTEPAEQTEVLSGLVEKTNSGRENSKGREGCLGKSPERTTRVTERREDRFGSAAVLTAEARPGRTAVGFPRRDRRDRICLNGVDGEEHGCAFDESSQLSQRDLGPMAAMEVSSEEDDEENWLANPAAYAQASGTPSPVPRRKGLLQRRRTGADVASRLCAPGRKWRPSLDAVAEAGAQVGIGGGDDDGGGVGAYGLTGRAAARFKGRRWSLEYLEEKKKEKIALEASRSAECIF